MYEILYIIVSTLIVNLLLYFFFWRKKIQRAEKLFSEYLADLDNENSKLKNKIIRLEEKLEKYESILCKEKKKKNKK